MKKWMLILFSALVGFSFISCSTQESYDVYVTVYPLKYVTEEIFEGTGYTVEIVPGVTSHENSVDWAPKEIIAMTEATYLFYVGGNYDQYIDYQINSIFTNKDVELVKIQDQTSYIEFIEGVIHVHEDETDDHTLGVDPHFWVSPLKVQQVAALIYDKLKLKFDDPDSLMENNYNQLVEALQDLSDAYAEVIDGANKLVMTSTNIYGYLREDYGFEYISISPGYHEEAEQFTTQEKEEIVAHAVENDIRYIMYEMYTSSPLSNAVFTELAALDMNPIKIEFNILQALTDDLVVTGNNYITVMYDNLELLKLAVDYISE
ncbi:MAG: zinc ABC transporter substrate-binding protein [Bacilli bacterium]|nr:zinc ABC transporter substrate-binding protein [Bacilli bacterium]